MIGLIDVDSKIPNLALMKLSTYYKSIGETVEFVQDGKEYEKIFASAIFTRSKSICEDLVNKYEDKIEIGIRGELIKLFVDAGFIFHSEVCIWKNPVTEMQRTKALGLLHKQIKKDSSMCRQGIPDYLITMRKPGENLERITHTIESFPIDLWQNYASPVWMDIKQSNTLQRNSARDEKDERHICPLQLDVIQRGIELWSNPGDIVLDPFAGIGSSIYQALLMNRKGVGIELKDSYFKQAKLNCENAVKKVEERANEITMEDYIKRMMAN